MIKSLIGFAVFAVCSFQSVSAQTISWTSSTETAPWSTQSIPVSTVQDSADMTTITVNPSTTYQTVQGWGGCFNELGWDAMSVLDKKSRNGVMKSLFDSKDGCNFTICRMPIGSSDFAMGYYSLDDTPGDYSMSHFSIDRDKQKLIPYIKAAIKIQHKLKVWGSPWCPPEWMTTNGNYTGGARMTQTPEALSAYALYLEKTVLAYRHEKIDFYAVHPQNEPVYNNGKYPQCGWSGDELDNFIKNYLGPLFKKDNVPAQIWFGTLPTDDWDGYIAPILGDPDTLPYISGVGYQYDASYLVKKTHDKYPNLSILQTEMQCGDATNTWDYAEMVFQMMKRYMRNGGNGFMQWNMVLDQTGKSSWGWAQNAMITVDRNTKAVTYNPQYYAVKHFGNFVKPDAVVVSAKGSQDCVAFKNPDGSIVVELINADDSPEQVRVDFGNDLIEPTLPAHSLNTFVETAM